MIATELIGLWDTHPYDYGLLETSSLVFRGDGTGWSTWENAAGGISVRRFTWRCPSSDTVELRYTVVFTGRYDPESTAPMTVDEKGPDTTVLRTRYSVGHDSTVLTERAFTALHLADSVEFSHDFALVRRDIQLEDDPARHLPWRHP